MTIKIITNTVAIVVAMGTHIRSRALNNLRKRTLLLSALSFPGITNTTSRTITTLTPRAVSPVLSLSPVHGRVVTSRRVWSIPEIVIVTRVFCRRIVIPNE